MGFFVEFRGLVRWKVVVERSTAAPIGLLLEGARRQMEANMSGIKRGRGSDVLGVAAV